MRRRLEVRSAPVLALLWALLCMGQTASGTVLATVRGVVHDSSHRPIAGADIEISAVASQFHRKLESDAAGAFEIDALPFGEYRVTVTASGFAGHQEQVLVHSGSAPVLHVELLPAGPHETVQVNDQETSLQTVSPATETTIARQQIEQ